MTEQLFAGDDPVSLFVQAVEARKAAEARVKELEEQVEAQERISTELRLVSAGEVGDRMFQLELACVVWPLLARALAVWFKENGGKNFIVQDVEFEKTAGITVDDHLLGRYQITMQKAGAMTPAQKLTELQARVAELETENRELRDRELRKRLND